MADDPTHLDNLQALRILVVAKRRDVVNTALVVRRSYSEDELHPWTGYESAKELIALQQQLDAIDDAIAEEVHYLDGEDE